MKTGLYRLIAQSALLILSLAENPFIPWEAGRKLTWDDFKAPPDKRSPNAAETSSAIKFDYSYNAGELRFHIVCQFDKNKSWVRVRSDYILSHEQGHFDITEIFARKLNKSVKEYRVGKPGDLTRDLNHIYENAMHQLHDMQAAYDAETNFSINTPKQEEWLKKIKTRLEELETYEPGS